VLKWYNNNKYSRLGNDLSVTELLRSPRQNHLSDRYRKQVKKTSMDQIMAALKGNGVHDQLQKYLRREATINSNWMIERRLCTVIDGLRVTGRFDALYDLKDLYDIKTCKVYKILKGDYSEWEAQLNAYDWMLYQDGITINSLKIYAVISDWNAGDTWQTGYPATSLFTIPIKKWDAAAQETWLKTRVKLWKDSRHLADDKLPLCTTEERWANATVYKLFRTPTLKKANKTFPIRKRAENYMNACKTKDPDKWKDALIREDTANKWRRCGWCDGADFCNQFKQKLEP